jgi:uncharacterized protein
VLEQPILQQIVVVSFVAIAATVGVYGIVALIVRMDDIGLKLIRLGKGKNGFVSAFGNLLIRALPLIIKGLAVVGTIALLLVAGGIFVHNLHLASNNLNVLTSTLLDFTAGLVVGMIALLLVNLTKRLVVMIRK